MKVRLLSICLVSLFAIACGSNTETKSEESTQTEISAEEKAEVEKIEAETQRLSEEKESIEKAADDLDSLVNNL